MRNQSKTMSYIVVVVVLLIGIYGAVTKRTEAPTQEPPIQAPVKVATDEIVVDVPVIGQVLSSGTLKVSGKARGSWYFEANAPFEIQDSNKKMIAQSYVMAQGEWMTTEFVPFEGQIVFTVPQGMKEGFVVFRNDNPSGEPSRDRFVSVPVKFQ